jgi:hypothetical protein
MALRWMDGCGESVADAALILRTKYASAGIIGTSTITRTGVGRSMGLATGAYALTRGLGCSGNEYYVGFATRFVDTDHLSDGSTMFFLQEGLNGPTHVSIGTDLQGRIRAYIGNGGSRTLVGTSTYQLFPFRWFCIEVGGVLDDSAGTIIVKVDGVTKLSLTGLDTNNGGTSTWDRFGVAGYINGSQVVLYDDVYACDGSGGAPWNSFLGTPTKFPTVLNTMPKTGAPGTHNDFIPTPSSDHAANVDEIPPNEQDLNTAGTVVSVDHNDSDVPGDKDSYKYLPLVISGDILGVQINPYAKQTNAGVRTVRTFVRQGGVDYAFPDAIELPTDYEYRSQIFEKNPATNAAWTEPEVNDVTAEIGLEIVT